MTVIQYSNARKNFRSLIDKVNDDSDVIIVTTKDNKNAVLLAEDDYNSMVESLYLISQPANARHLEESIQQLDGGKTHVVTFNE